MTEQGQPVGLETTFSDPGLYVGVLVFNQSGLFEGPLSANNFDGNSYNLAYTFPSPGAWWTKFVVYNEPELETRNTDYDASSKGFQVVVSSSGGSESSNSLIGIINQVQLVGTVQENDELSATVQNTSQLFGTIDEVIT